MLAYANDGYSQKSSDKSPAVDGVEHMLWSKSGDNLKKTEG